MFSLKCINVSLCIFVSSNTVLVTGSNWSVMAYVTNTCAECHYKVGHVAVETLAREAGSKGHLSDDDLANMLLTTLDIDSVYFGRLLMFGNMIY